MFKTVGSKQASSWDASAQQTLLCAMPVKTIWCHHNNRRTTRVISYYLWPLLTTNTKFVDFVENEVSVALRSLPMSLLHVTVIGVGNAVSERRGKNWSCSIPWSKTDHFLRARNMHGRAQGESRQLIVRSSSCFASWMHLPLSQTYANRFPSRLWACLRWL